MLLATGVQILRYDAPDATAWRCGGVFFAAPGLDHGAPWECPQLLFDGEAAALVVSCQDAASAWPRMHAVAFVGAVRDGRFDGTLDGRLDHGDVFYAPAVTAGAPGGELLWRRRVGRPRGMAPARRRDHVTSAPSSWITSPSAESRPPARRSQIMSQCTALSLTPPVSG